MLRLTARLVSKSLFKEGTNKWGAYQIVRFIVQKQHNKEKKKIIFIAMGKAATAVQDFPINERITIHFEPKCTMFNGKWYTELKATSVEKYINRKKVLESMKLGAEPIEEQEYTYQSDAQLFDKE